MPSGTMRGRSSDEEDHFVHDCCQILGSQKDEKMRQISKAAVDLGKGDLSRTIKTKRNLLESICAEVEAHRRKVPGPSQTTRNMSSLKACRMEYPCSNTTGLVS